YANTNQLPVGPPPQTINLTSTGGYNGASVTLTRNNVYVYQPFSGGGSPQFFWLQPSPGADTYLNLNAAGTNRNYGGDIILRVWSSNYQSLLKFDFSVFPAGSRVISYYQNPNKPSQQLIRGAQLYLY